MYISNKFLVVVSKFFNEYIVNPRPAEFTVIKNVENIPKSNINLPSTNVIA